MATITDFITNLKSVVVELQAKREGESIQISKETAALIRLRVQNDKVDANGNSFGSYSTSPVPKWFFRGKSLSAGAEEKTRKGKFFISYEEFRDNNNLPTDAKNYTFSGDMWRNIGVTEVVSTDTETSTKIGGTTDRARTLLAYNTERDGAILEANDQEKQFIVDSHTERIFNTIKKYLG